jgi:hypothetical protein
MDPRSIFVLPDVTGAITVAIVGVLVIVSVLLVLGTLRR